MRILTVAITAPTFLCCCTILTLLVFLPEKAKVLASTDVKWTAAEQDPNDAAATAPRSQRYWDEHGITRPDYAKTDAEIAAERRANGDNGSTYYFSPLFICGLLIGILGGLAAGWYVKKYHPVNSGGGRLGTASDGSKKFFFSDSANREDEDAIRQARLAHFQQGKLD